MVTDSTRDNPCGFYGSPFINNCDYDTAGAMFAHLYNNNTLAKRVPVDQNSFGRVSQADHVPGRNTAGISVGPDAYVGTQVGISSACQMLIVFVYLVLKSCGLTVGVSGTRMCQRRAEGPTQGAVCTLRCMAARRSGTHTDTHTL